MGANGSRPGEARIAWRHLPAIVLTGLLVLPLVFLVSGSLREPGLPPPLTPPLVPEDPTLESYARSWELVGLLRQLVNSVIVVAFAVPLTVVVASWAGFAISRLPRRWSAAMVAASLVALMIPATALLVPRFALFRAFRLTDTFVPLVAPALIGTSPFYVLLFAWSFRWIPLELFEASRLEGMSPFDQWRRVAMPLARPVTVAVAVLAFVVTWSNFLDPLVYLFDPDKYTAPLGLRALAGLAPGDYPMLLAGAMTVTLPVLVAFLYVQRFLLQERGRMTWLGG